MEPPCGASAPNRTHRTHGSYKPRSQLNQLARELHGPRLPHHRHLDFAWIVQLLFDRPRDVVTDLEGLAVRSLRRVRYDAHLATGLDRVSMLDAGETRRHRFQFFQALDVLLQRLTASAGPRGADASADATNTV